MDLVIDLDALPYTEQAHDFVGAAHGVSVSAILVHSAPGDGPEVHRHPYDEVFVIESGTATFTVDDVSVQVEGRKVVVAPSNSWHGFKNTGTTELRLVAIHPAPKFNTEWRNSPDPAWVSRPEDRDSATARVDKP
jgi:mannose-6-phosphate isomerase-like protein (cupin superfamily)